LYILTNCAQNALLSRRAAFEFTLITEFGRTARINGTEGTDHGTATVALLVGSAPTIAC